VIFDTLMNEVAALVKKYRGSMSGEHGDGRVRGKFIPFMLGEHNYQLVRQVKKAWDPDNIFNPGKNCGYPANYRKSARYSRENYTRFQNRI
jgi:FAD/FMN-containing dehydrogenase